MFLSKTAGVLTVVALALGVVAAQDAAPGSRTFISDLTPPGIDNGLHNSDAPRPPRPCSPTDLSSRNGVPLPARQHRREVPPGHRARRAAHHDGSHRRLDAWIPRPTPTSTSCRSSDSADPEAAATTLAKQPDVEYAQARYIVHPMFVPNDPLYAQQWNFPRSTWRRRGI